MIYEVETYVELDEMHVIIEYGLTKNSTDDSIRNAVTDYINGLDDSDYYLVSDTIKKEFIKLVKETLNPAYSFRLDMVNGVPILTGTPQDK